MPPALIMLEQLVEEEGPVIEAEAVEAEGAIVAEAEVLAPKIEAAAKAVEEGAEALAQDVESEAESILNKVENALSDSDVGETAAKCEEETGASAEEAAAQSGKPEWLQRIQAGNEFNKTRAPFYEYNEVYVENPEGGYVRLDSYDPQAGEIVSRKFTQFSEIQESTGVNYVSELANKYPPGSTIANVPSSGALAGQQLQGQMILEVPVQNGPIPQSVLDAAAEQNIVIRDVNGNIY